MEIQRSGNYGLIPVSNATHVERVLSDEARAEAALKANNQPMITGLAAHVKTCFEAAKTEKREVEQRMLSSMRARRGEYDPEVLANIKATGGVEIFMMLSSAKARAATSVLRDIYLGNGSEKPWSASPTKIPELPQKSMDEAVARAGELVQQIQDMMGGPQAVPDSQIEELLELARARSEVEVSNEAKESMQAMERKMEDQLQEGNFVVALSEFLDDLSTFPSAILKGPVVRNKPQLSWSNTTGGYEPVVETKKTLEWERVSPFNFYPSPGASEVNEGYCVEVHELYPSSLEELIGVDGYSENAIKEVIKRCLIDWNSSSDMAVGTSKGVGSSAEKKKEETEKAVK